MSETPLWLLESDAAFDRALATLRADGWEVRLGWDPEPRAERAVCAGAIESANDLQDAVLAAVEGYGIAALVSGRRDLLERLYEDLSRFGRVEVRTAEDDPLFELDPDERAVLELLGTGVALGEAARALFVSRRTADRRLASAREKLGVSTTAEAVLLARQSNA